jgi:ferredoxin-NADP reductase
MDIGHLEDEATTLPESARHHPVTWHHITEEGRHVIFPFKIKQLSEYWEASQLLLVTKQVWIGENREEGIEETRGTDMALKDLKVLFGMK